MRMVSKAKQKQQKKKRLAARRKRQQQKESATDAIRQGGDPILSQQSNDIEKDDNLSFLWTMRNALCATETGVGMAAVQIGILKRAFVLRVHKDKEYVQFFLNPKVIPLEEEAEKVSSMEGCLSYPGKYVTVERDAEIKISYLDENFQEKEKHFTGLAARVVQHEMDHFDGVCIVGGLRKEYEYVQGYPDEE